jgi:hypothetical protein
VIYHPKIKINTIQKTLLILFIVVSAGIIGIIYTDYRHKLERPKGTINCTVAKNKLKSDKYISLYEFGELTESEVRKAVAERCNTGNQIINVYWDKNIAQSRTVDDFYTYEGISLIFVVIMLFFTRTTNRDKLREFLLLIVIISTLFFLDDSFSSLSKFIMKELGLLIIVSSIWLFFRENTKK